MTSCKTVQQTPAGLSRRSWPAGLSGPGSGQSSGSNSQNQTSGPTWIHGTVQSRPEDLQKRSLMVQHGGGGVMVWAGLQLQTECSNGDSSVSFWSDKRFWRVLVQAGVGSACQLMTRVCSGAEGGAISVRGARGFPPPLHYKVTLFLHGFSSCWAALMFPPCRAGVRHVPGRVQSHGGLSGRRSEGGREGQADGREPHQTVRRTWEVRFIRSGRWRSTSPLQNQTSVPAAESGRLQRRQHPDPGSRGHVRAQRSQQGNAADVRQPLGHQVVSSDVHIIWDSKFI